MLLNYMLLPAVAYLTLVVLIVPTFGRSRFDTVNSHLNVTREIIPRSDGKPCYKDHDCGKKDTCNLYTRRCERCALRDELCRRTGNCCGKDLFCVYGTCRDKLKSTGKKGHTCKDSSECNPGLCCAKYHGVFICQQYQQLGDMCSLPEGGVEFSVRHNCPCLHGLKCAKVSPDPTDWRCVWESPFGKK